MQHLYKLIRYFRRRTKQLARLAEKQTNSMGYGDEINTRYHEHNSGDDPRLQEKIELMKARTSAKYESVKGEVSNLKSALGNVALVKEDGSKRSNFDMASEIISGPHSSAAMRLASALAKGIDSYKAALLHERNNDDEYGDMFDGDIDENIFGDLINDDDNIEDDGSFNSEDVHMFDDDDNIEDDGHLFNSEDAHMFDDAAPPASASDDRRNGWV